MAKKKGWLKESDTHVCDNCRKEWSSCPPAKDLFERVEPGGVMPSGECPECGALCYLRLLTNAEERNAECLAWARSRVAHLERDERFHYEPALVQVNAPLALIQVEMKTEHRALSAVVKMLKAPAKRKERRG